MVSDEESVLRRWAVQRYSNDHGHGFKPIGSTVFVDASSAEVAVKHLLPIVTQGWQFAQDGRSSVAIRGKQLVRAVLYHHLKEHKVNHMQQTFTVVSGTWYEDQELGVMNVKDVQSAGPYDNQDSAIGHAKALLANAGPDQYVIILTWEGKTNVHSRTLKEAATTQLLEHHILEGDSVVSL